MLILLGLMPKLYIVNFLINFAHSLACSIVDFILAIKICELDLYKMYLDPTDFFKGKVYAMSVTSCQHFGIHEARLDLLFQHEELPLVYKDVGHVIVGLVKD